MGRDKRGQLIDIDATIEVDVDEYLEYASDDALLEELAERELDFTSLVHLDFEDKMRVITQGLTITKAYEVQEAVKKILNY